MACVARAPAACRHARHVRRSVRASAAPSAFPLEGVALRRATDGAPVPLPSWGDDDTVVVAFLRHFGWVFCWEQGAALAAVKPSLEAAGCSLLTVGIGTPEKAREFAERVGYPVEDLYTDETRAAYKALEMYGDLDGTEGMFFDPKVVEGVRRLFFTRITGERIKERGQEGIRKAMENYKPLMPSEPRDTVQQGGTFVFRGTETLFAHKDEATADHADLALVVEAAAAGAAAVQQQASQ